MSRRTLKICLLQVLLTACAVAVAVLAEMPLIAVIGLALGGLQAIQVTRGVPIGKVAFVVGWACVLGVAGSLLRAELALDIWGGYLAAPAWLTAATLVFAGAGLADVEARTRCRVLALAWAFVADSTLLAAAYWCNQALAFYAGLFILVGLLILCKAWFRLRLFAIQLVNTLILLAIGLAVVDGLFRSGSSYIASPDPRKRYYSYAYWKKDPVAFARWWTYSLHEQHMLGRIFTHDLADGTDLPFRLKPNSRCSLYRSTVLINSLGFRGREIAVDKGQAYRIVALGESTTFGLTMNPEDRPWPELLEQMIQQRLKPARPVEVINAGVPAYDLAKSLARLPRDILPLHPDLVISYHGYNGFSLLASHLPPILAVKPVSYTERPSRLLAACEYHVKLIYHRRRQATELARHPPNFAEPMESAYAEDYRMLIESARTNHFRLALANYSMAVNARSDPQVVEFYQATVPSVRWQMQANAAHSLIVQQLAAEHPEVCLVDTHPHLDGEHDKFVDVMHLTQEGRAQLAENVFASICDVLATDLGLPAGTNTTLTTRGK